MFPNYVGTRMLLGALLITGRLRDPIDYDVIRYFCYLVFCKVCCFCVFSLPIQSKRDIRMGGWNNWRIYYVVSARRMLNYVILSPKTLDALNTRFILLSEPYSNQSPRHLFTKWVYLEEPCSLIERAVIIPRANNDGHQLIEFPKVHGISTIFHFQLIFIGSHTYSTGHNRTFS